VEPDQCLSRATFLIRSVDPKKDDLQFSGRMTKGNLLHDFTGWRNTSHPRRKLVFAANAGHVRARLRARRPARAKRQRNGSPLNLNDGQGNFYMKPNGVFLINEKHEARSSNRATTRALTPAVWATQSGPLLVHGGDIHPDFNAGSKNLKIRSGVGVRKDGMIVFALSRKPVNFYDFASLFRSTA
jgi:uncharacterized protein YigE (DUF2233 family)